MKKSIWIFCLTIVITGILSFENSAIAVLNVSGNVAQDSNTGFEWLVMSQTVKKSPDRIMAGDYGLKGMIFSPKGHLIVHSIRYSFLTSSHSWNVVFHDSIEVKLPIPEAELPKTANFSFLVKTKNR